MIGSSLLGEACLAVSFWTLTESIVYVSLPDQATLLYSSNISGAG